MIFDIIVILLFMFWVASFGPLLATIIEYGFEVFEKTFNPIALYKNGNFNWFGAVVIAVFLNIVFMPIAIVFWIHKLFTVGRR